VESEGSVRREHESKLAVVGWMSETPPLLSAFKIGRLSIHYTRLMSHVNGGAVIGSETPNMESTIRTALIRDVI
jgi:hypothetical protein